MPRASQPLFDAIRRQLRYLKRGATAPATFVAEAFLEAKGGFC